MKKTSFLINALLIITLFACKENNSTQSDITENVETNKVVFKVDAKIELLRIAFNLAVQDYIDPKMLPCDTDYSKRVNKHFENFKNHQLIKYIDDSPNIIIDFPTIGLMFKDLETFEFDNTYFQELSGFKMTKNEIDSLQPLLIDFSKKSNFEIFFEKNKSYYQDALKTIEKQVNEEKLFDKIVNFFQSKEKGLEMIVFVELTNSFNNKAVSFFDNYNPKKRATILANICEKPDKSNSTNEIMELDDNRRGILYHETSHLFTDKLLNKYIGDLSQYRPICEDCNEIEIKDKVDHLIVNPLQWLLQHRINSKDDGHNYFLNECEDIRKEVYTKLNEYQPDKEISFEQIYSECINLIKLSASEKLQSTNNELR
ncbi:hypothetical protein ULMS_09350 [Patiriisocius marinistellae]|uniref:DUF4932 domain-containing protein n=1 Tax=Patiriisocius marinistellae TaxID=2494560 RepID=A0A5J4FSX4_9FLAO|nr:DUF4932 domain-containing protein [Patiriisocius marinistellae]GEQ85427.1 hypothetical protein ULMS_09350 [Patiriisocius marinistellae]